MAKRVVYDDRLYAHFLTFSVAKRRRLLDLDQPKRLVLGALNEQLTRDSALCIGFVLMPDHVHATVWLPKIGMLSSFMHGWKRKSSFRIRNWYRDNSPNYVSDFGEGQRFWQPKYYAFEIESQRKLDEKTEYVHLNPVRAGLVERAIDYPWSSACWYESRRSVGVPITPFN